MKYQIKITYPSGLVAYLIHHDRLAWTKRTAAKYLAEFTAASGLACELEVI